MLTYFFWNKHEAFYSSVGICCEAKTDDTQRALLMDGDANSAIEQVAL